MGTNIARLDSLIFLWGYLKQKVYSTPIPNIHILKQRITEYTQTIDGDVLKSVFLNIEKRLDLVIEVSGQHIEHLL